MPIHLHSDVLYDVLKFCNRFDINERFEFVDAHWARCIAASESKHFALYKMDKLWICSLFCSLHYSLQPYSETTVAEIFNHCSKNCEQKYLHFVSDDWPAQRVPFCIYIQRSTKDATSLKKITMNNGSWKVERPECAHFFVHFRDLCFRKAHMDLLNDRAVTWFLLDCPIFHISAEHLTLRTTTDPFPFNRIVQLAQQKVALKCYCSKNAKTEYCYMTDAAWLDSVEEQPVIKFILGGKNFCSRLILETPQIALLFDLIKEYESAPSLQLAIPIVRLFVPSFPWHQRQFIEQTLCQMFHTSAKLGPLVHHFGYIDEMTTIEKFSCFVRYQEIEEDKINCYEFRISQ